MSRAAGATARRPDQDGCRRAPTRVAPCRSAARGRQRAAASAASRAARRRGRGSPARTSSPDASAGASCADSRAPQPRPARTAVTNPLPSGTSWVGGVLVTPCRSRMRCWMSSLSLKRTSGMAPQSIPRPHPMALEEPRGRGGQVAHRDEPLDRAPLDRAPGRTSRRRAPRPSAAARPSRPGPPREAAARRPPTTTSVSTARNQVASESALTTTGRSTRARRRWRDLLAPRRLEQALAAVRAGPGPRPPRSAGTVWSVRPRPARPRTRAP